MASGYGLLARLLGTKPIHVRLAVDAFTFSSGSTQSHLRPLVWCDHSGSAGKVLAIGNEVPPAGALPVDLTSAQVVAVPTQLRQKALEAVLVRGFRALAREATIQRPNVIFQNDGVLARAFDGQQREALRQAASAAGAFESRFE